MDLSLPKEDPNPMSIRMYYKRVELGCNEVCDSAQQVELRGHQIISLLKALPKTSLLFRASASPNQMQTLKIS